MIPGPLVDSVQAVQVGRQTPPEALDLGGMQGHQVPFPGQPPEELPWYTRTTTGYHGDLHLVQVTEQVASVKFEETPKITFAAGHGSVRVNILCNFSQKYIM